MTDVALRELGQALNRIQTAELAIVELQNTPEEEVSDEPVDPDWASRWDEWAGKVSNPNLKRYWARVLAGEIKRPGSFSFHTLDLLSRLSQEEAMVVDRAAKLRISYFRVDDFIFCGNQWGDTLLNRFGLPYEDLLALSDLGITNSTEGLASRIPLKANSKQWLFRLHNKVLGVECSNRDVEVIIPYFKFTRMGRELCSLGTEYQACEEYMRIFVETLKQQGVEVAIGDLQAKPGNPENFNVTNPVKV